ATAAAAAPAAGRHPRASATGTRTATWIASTAATPAILAETRAGRPSGVAPRRFSTRYSRSKPVAMARLTIAVDITARARTPGARKVTERGVPVGRTSASEK